MVTGERLMAISQPLKARHFWSSRRLLLISISIFSLMFINQVHMWFFLSPAAIDDCVKLGEKFYHLQRIKTNSSLYDLVSSNLVWAPAVGVLTPLFLIMVFNGLLIFSLQRNRSNIRLVNEKCSQRLICWNFFLMLNWNLICLQIYKRTIEQKYPISTNFDLKCKLTCYPCYYSEFVLKFRSICQTYCWLSIIVFS